jgi:phage tail-like protein
MAGDVSAQPANMWPMPKFYFEVKWAGGMVSLFQEVSGLDIEAKVIEYRSGDDKVFSTVKMPGIMKYRKVTLKKGVFVNDNNFYDWYAKINMNTIGRTSVTISLLDESGAPTMVWTLINAWPTKLTGTDLKSDGNEVAIETIELAHEGIEIANV